MDDAPHTKRCTICLQELPATSQYFAPRAKSVYGVRAQCRQCMKDRQLKKVHQVVPGTQKQCSRCKKFYPATEQYFQHDRHCADSFCSACKNCTNSTNKHILTSLPIPEGCKCCLKCEKVYPATDEYFPSIKGIQRNHCRVCVRANSHKNYRNAHPQKEPIPEGYKLCFGCYKVKPATREYFDAANIAKGIFHGRCKPCAKAYRAIMTDESRFIPLPQGTMKQCSACKQILPATSEYFHKGRIIHGGLRSICRPCLNAHSRMKYNQANICQVDGMKVCAHCKQAKPATLEYFHAHRMQRFGLVSVCRECKSVYDKRYLQEHPGIGAIKHNRRRAHKNGNGGTYSLLDVQRMYKAQKGKCYYCHVKLSNGYRERHIDHIVPLSRGGSNDPSNIVIACRRCNLSKGTKLLHEWTQAGRLL